MLSISLSDCTPICKGRTDGQLVVDDNAARVSFTSDVGDGVGHSVVSMDGPAAATSVAAEDPPSGRAAYCYISSYIYSYIST